VEDEEDEEEEDKPDAKYANLEGLKQLNDVMEFFLEEDANLVIKLTPEK
jgi:hypothetical protein